MAQAQYELVKPSELLPADRTAWREFVAADPALGSPYFALEFAECCEEARDDTRVVIKRRGGQACAFLPLQVGKLGYARPLAGPLGDVHGVIAAPGEEFDVSEALVCVRIPVFNFDSVLASQTCFADATTHRDGSWVMNLSKGFDAWRAERKSASPRAVKNLDMRRRRMERFEGGYRFVMDDRRSDVFETMVSWKRAQYQRTGVFDVFSVGWTSRLLKAILRREGDHFCGLISTLSIGDRIAALHVGMASDRVCHYWFPAYDTDFGRLSPGILMIEEMAKVAAVMGHEALELGPGDYQFKRDLASYQLGLGSGYIVSPSLLGMARQATRALIHAAEGAPLGPFSTFPGRAMRKVDRLVSFHAA